MSAPAPHEKTNNSPRFWHSVLEVEIHGLDAVRSLTTHDPDRRWRVVVDEEVGVVAYVHPEAAEMLVSALRREHGV